MASNVRALMAKAKAGRAAAAAAVVASSSAVASGSKRPLKLNDSDDEDDEDEAEDEAEDEEAQGPPAKIAKVQPKQQQQQQQGQRWVRRNAMGQLVCLACSVTFKDDVLWPPHSLSKRHKDNVALASKTAPSVKTTAAQAAAPSKAAPKPPGLVAG